MDIKALHKEGHSIKQIARHTGHSRNTVRRVLRQPVPPTFQTPERSSCLDPYKDYLQERWQSSGLNAVRLLAQIQPMGYSGSISTLRRFLATLKPAQQRLQRLTVRFESPPGKQAQADWAYCGRFTYPAGKPYPVYPFVIVLGFSRMLYVEFTRSMHVSELIRCHKNAFAFFGGWPQEILYDNMKQVRLNVETLQPQFADFARHYNITIKTHRVRRPRTKGKVERMVHYVKDAFLNGRSFHGLDDLNAQARQWLTHTANVRPVDLWPREGLSALTLVAPYPVLDLLPRKAGFDGFVRFQGSRYSLPPEHAGKPVLIGHSEHRVVIRVADMIVAEHAPATRSGSSVADPAHLESLWKLSLQNTAPPPPNWQLSFSAEVEATPLTVYQEAAQ